VNLSALIVEFYELGSGSAKSPVMSPQQAIRQKRPDHPFSGLVASEYRARRNLGQFVDAALVKGAPGLSDKIVVPLRR